MATASPPDRLAGWLARSVKFETSETKNNKNIRNTSTVVEKLFDAGKVNVSNESVARGDLGGVELGRGIVGWDTGSLGWRGEVRRNYQSYVN